MSFRMRGRAFRAARNAATWLLIVSTISSTAAWASNPRRELRRALRNGCCPTIVYQPCVPKCCVVIPCDPCKSGAALLSPYATPASPQPTIAPQPAPAEPKSETKEKAADSNIAAPSPFKTIPAAPASNSAPATTPTLNHRSIERETPPIIAEESKEPAGPIIVTEQAPPTPPTAEVKKPVEPADPFAPRERTEPAPEQRVELKKPAIEPKQEEDPFAQNDPFAQPTTPAAEPAKETPAVAPTESNSSKPRYQEYLDRYFNRNRPARPQPSEEEEEEESPSIPETRERSTPSNDDPPILTPTKPAKEYNDPFRPTSYRSSPERSWRDSSGSARMKAKFLGVDDRGMAKMQREDGRITRIPLSSLSRDDQRYIELLAIRDTAQPPQAIAARPKGN